MAYIDEFNNALGAVDFRTKSPLTEYTLDTFIKYHREDGCDHNTFIVLKDIHRELSSPVIIALLKRIAEDNLYKEDYNYTVFIISPEVVIPSELKNYITVFDIPLPSGAEMMRREQELRQLVSKFLESYYAKKSMKLRCWLIMELHRHMQEKFAHEIVSRADERIKSLKMFDDGNAYTAVENAKTLHEFCARRSLRTGLYTESRACV